MTRAQTRMLISMGTSVFALTSAYKDLRRARSDGDRLALIDAVIHLAAVVTSLAVTVRAVREGGE